MLFQYDVFNIYFYLYTDHLSPDLKKCSENLKHYYLDRVNKTQSTRWRRLGPSPYIDVTLIRAQYSSSRMDNDSMERFNEEYAMGLLDNRADLDYVTVDDILEDGHGRVVLVEGDPGAGKTTLTLQLCKRWAKSELPKTNFVFWVPLRDYKSVTNQHELFDKLGCPEIIEYVKQNNGEGLVLILDGWDELPNQLQESSLFHDIVFKNILFNRSTVIVTSRPVSCDEIAELVEERKTHYQILGFSPENADKYIEEYFNNNNHSQSAKLLLAFLKDRENLRRHFYIPITVKIMCFVCKNDHQIPETLSKLYERFVVLHIHPHITDQTCQRAIKKFSTLNSIPKKIKPVFDKLCKIAFNMLKDKELTFDEEELEEEVENLDMEHFDGFGMLHVDNYTSDVALREKCYSFIHRAVQELLAAIFILGDGNVSNILDEHFYKGSYLINVFPFLFGLISKEKLRPLAGNLIQVFIRSNRNRKLLASILYCLFEAQDETLCSEFAKVFDEKKEVNLQLASLLEYRYASYVLSVCGGEKLKVDLSHSVELTEPHAEVMAKYLHNTSTDIASFKCLVQLTHKGMEYFAKVLAGQCNLLSVKLYSLGFLPPNCVKILCQSICQYNTKITELDLPYAKLSTEDLESLGLLLATCISLQELHMNESQPSEDVCLLSSQSFYNGLCSANSLKEFCLGNWSLSWVESEMFGNVLKHNKSLKELHALQVNTVDCLGPILDGLSCNSSVTLLRIWPKSTGASNSLGQCLENCLIQNSSLTSIDFAWYHGKCVSWSSTQVCSICTGLCANTTVVTLDISGCYIDTEACHAVCGILSQSTTLQHLFLNPVRLEKQEAITMIESCRDNDTLELLSLVQWPDSEFIFSSDKDIEQSLQYPTKSVINVYWLVGIQVCVDAVIMYVHVGRLMSVEESRIRYTRANKSSGSVL